MSYRDELGQVVYDSVSNTDMDRVDCDVVGEAVAVKVLRDLIESLNVVDDPRAAVKVAQFAKIVGIDLGDMA